MNKEKKEIKEITREELEKYTSDPIFFKLDAKENHRLNNEIFNKLPLSSEDLEELYYELKSSREEKVLKRIKERKK